MKLFNGKTVPLYYLRMTAEKRKQLIQGLFKDLILNERIKTTYAKAKYLSFWAEQSIELAKNEKNRAILSKELSLPQPVMDKLFGSLAARFKNKSEGFVKIHRTEHRRYKKACQGPTQWADYADMAVIELQNGPKSIGFLLAKQHKSTVETKLAAIEEKLYDKVKYNIVDPVTQEPLEVVELKEKPLSAIKLRTLKKNESFYRRLLLDLDQEIKTTDQCVKNTQDYMENRLKAYQQKIDLYVAKKQQIPAVLIASLQAEGFRLRQNRVEKQPEVEPLIKPVKKDDLNNGFPAWMTEFLHKKKSMTQ